jgi:hypothetical protein
MTTHPTAHILTRLEFGLRTDSTRLIEIEQEMLAILAKARGLGTEYGSPPDWSNAWSHHWDLIEIILLRIHALITEMHEEIQGTGERRLELALKAWDTLKLEESRLAQTIAALHGQSHGLNPTARDQWQTIELEFDDHLDIVQTCAEALHVKLLLLNQHSTEEVEIQVQKILARLARHPNTQDSNVPDYDAIYQQAAAALKQESNRCLGFMDIVKGMFMWVETTEERADTMLSKEHSNSL